MSDHVALSVNLLMAKADSSSMIREGYLAPLISDGEEEESSLAEKGSCRICREEDDMKHLIAPCSCDGTIKMVHEDCLARWCIQKRSLNCEICLKPFNAECATESAAAPPSPNPPIASVDDIAQTLRAEPANPDAILAEVYSRELFGGVDECATYAGTRNCIIRIAILFPLIFYFLRISRESLDYSDRSLINEFSIFSVNVVTIMTPIYILMYGVHLYFRYRERKEANVVRYQVANMIYEENVRRYDENVRRYQEIMDAAGATIEP